MKRFYLVLLALISLSASVFADGLTATLQQGDVMTPFYGVEAFKDAYAAAKDGAVITLSSGKFNDVEKVAKQITVIGAYAFEPESSETTFLGSTQITADNVKIEGVYFSGDVRLSSIRDTIENFVIKRCWVDRYLSGDEGYNKNTIVDQCVIKKDNAIKHGLNYCIKNSTIECFANSNEKSYMAYITNCVVWRWCDYTNVITIQPYAVYKNNYLGIVMPGYYHRTLSIDSGSEFYNNLFFTAQPSTIDNLTLEFKTGCVNEKNEKFRYLPTEKLNEYPAHIIIETFFGSDRTPVGPYGGTGFSEYPAIPRITSKSIDANSDAEGKINVKITVKAE